MINKPKIGLMIVGDEILSGRRQDAHLSKVISLLKERGLQLAWAKFVPDDLDVLVQEYKETLKSGHIIFSSGGIGSTPDDKTREAMAQALGVPLELHPEAEALITERSRQLQAKGVGTADMSTVENQRRLAMGYFPQGSEIVPNPYNQIPGFYIHNHTFVPGFPEMAWPMLEWTLDNRYASLHNTQKEEAMGVIVYGVPESRLTSALETIEKQWQGIRTFSLPTVAKDNHPAYIDLGVKGSGPDLKEAFDYLRGAVLRVGGHFMPRPKDES